MLCKIFKLTSEFHGDRIILEYIENIEEIKSMYQQVFSCEKYAIKICFLFSVKLYIKLIVK